MLTSSNWKREHKEISWEAETTQDRVKSWSKEKRIQEQLALEKLEEELALLYKQKTQGVFSYVTDHRLKFLEAERNKHLLAEEDRWRQKSRAIWIQSGDKNTKFFPSLC
jgi:hypothetical protein